LAAAALVSFAIGQISEAGADTSFLLRIVHFSPAAHFWQFALGALTYLYFERISGWTGRLCATRLGLLLPAIAYILFGGLVCPMLPKLLSTIATTLCLYALVLAAAVNSRPISGILKGNDISYGVYLFHMLATNALVELEMTGVPAVLIAFAATFALAWLSWNLVESRALGRKSLRKHQPAQTSVFSAP
jgi:peptidoglycan/LPS O-acetylase OafA/YrhL